MVDVTTDAKVTIAPSALSATGEWPARDAAGKTALRRYLVQELNYLMSARGDATITLPTRAVIAHKRSAAKDREVLRIRLATTMPSGDVVETSREVPWVGRADLPLSGQPTNAPPRPEAGLGSLLASGCCALSSTGAGMAIGGGVVAGVVVLALMAGGSQFDGPRAKELSDGLQHSLRDHALALREALAAKQGPVPVPLPHEGEDEDEDEPVEHGIWPDEPQKDASAPPDAELP